MTLDIKAAIQALRRAEAAVSAQSSHAMYPGQLVQYEQDSALLHSLAACLEQGQIRLRDASGVLLPDWATQPDAEKHYGTVRPVLILPLTPEETKL
jgi:hypothetical protein